MNARRNIGLRSFHRWLLMAAAAATSLLALPAAVCAQAKPAATPAAKMPTAEPVELNTGDGLKLHATFYASTKGKEAVPVVLVHGYKGSAAEYKDLALLLQAQGHAVLAPDLRGHGENKGTPKLVGDLPSRDLVNRIIKMDMEACKAFLLARNNAGELNIDRLCVVGAQMGCAAALSWAKDDWNWPVLSTGKQGQDVKALVLISPEWSAGISLKPVLDDPNIQSKLAILIIVGKRSSKALGEADRLKKVFKPYHTEGEGKIEEQTLFLVPFDTELQGTKLASEKALVANTAKLIGDFINYRLVKKFYPWRERKST